MDLVVLLGSSGPVVPPTVKGKGRAMGGNTKLALWRMSGTKVWSVDIDGSVRGLAWTHDGEMASERSIGTYGVLTGRTVLDYLGRQGRADFQANASASFGS